MNFKVGNFLFKCVCAGILVATASITTAFASKYSKDLIVKHNAHISRLHQDCYHRMVGSSENGTVGCLSNPNDPHEEARLATAWSVHPDHLDVVNHWRQKHEIFVKPAYVTFPASLLPVSMIKYNYVLYNRTINEVAKVKLKEILEMELFIEGIDVYQGFVLLSDSTDWKINPKDTKIKEWHAGQRIIVGVNNKWCEAEYPHILINLDQPYQPYVEADFYPRN